MTANGDPDSTMLKTAVWIDGLTIRRQGDDEELAELRAAHFEVARHKLFDLLAEGCRKYFERRPEGPRITIQVHPDGKLFKPHDKDGELAFLQCMVSGDNVHAYFETDKDCACIKEWIDAPYVPGSEIPEPLRVTEHSANYLEAMQLALSELGVPHEMTPAPVANAVSILRAAIRGERFLPT